MWVARLMLEGTLHRDIATATLTYIDEELPRNRNDLPVLSPIDVRNFFKRLRKRMEPLRLRYFLVGEYGDESWRPHYHAILFGLRSCVRGRTDLTRTYCCEACEKVKVAWGKGAVELRLFEPAGARYVAGYVTKKLTQKDDVRLAGRVPEFMRCSRDPGIAGDYVLRIADQINEYAGLSEKLEDVPGQVRIGGDIYAIGRYLRGRLREALGRDKEAPEATIRQVEAELWPLLELAAADAEAPSLGAQIRKANVGLSYRLEVLEAIRKARRGL